MDSTQVDYDANMYCRVAQKGDLAGINKVITDAVMIWPVSARSKKLIIPVLCYTENDLDYYKVFVWIDRHQIVGAVLWDSKRTIDTCRGYASLLHGIYVSPNLQGQGIGKALLAEVKDSAKASEISPDGLLIKAERVSVSFFEHCGLERITATSPGDYPYQFWCSL